jgi:glucose-6-phosphate isomerase
MSTATRTNMLVNSTPEWKDLEAKAEQIKNGPHLREMLKDSKRSEEFIMKIDNMVIDFSRQRMSTEALAGLRKLAEKAGVKDKIKQMMTGEKINTSEKRSVLHTALRAKRSESLVVDGEDVVKQVWEVLDQIKAFSDSVRAGNHVGVTGKKIKNFIAVGIGGSYLGPAFMHEALRFERNAMESSEGFNLRFLSNVDPTDSVIATQGLDPAETMVIVVSKTFTTGETMLNARTVRGWLEDALGTDEAVVRQHMIACSSAVDKVEAFGISKENIFPFWDWVGGRYSVCSSVGAVPLALQYGFDVVEMFLEGCNNVDHHFLSAPLEENVPVMMGLIGVWNNNFFGYQSRVINPYSMNLAKFAAHIQQVDMESNGKRVTANGEELPFNVGEVNFGEPGTNGQHSFFQLLHQGQVVPCDFIGFCENPNPVCLGSETLSNHDELMANFFAQPDALAMGKTLEQCLASGETAEIAPHKVFSGNRPSNIFLIDRLDPFTMGQLLALYEHRTAVQGFIWGINSFDQFGVELGKALSGDVRKKIEQCRYEECDVDDAFNPSTSTMLKHYLSVTFGCAL